jgi:hypothetical protein
MTQVSKCAITQIRSRPTAMRVRWPLCSYQDPTVQADKALWPFTVVSYGGLPYIDLLETVTTDEVATKMFSPQDVCRHMYAI